MFALSQYHSLISEQSIVYPYVKRRRGSSNMHMAIARVIFRIFYTKTFSSAPDRIGQTYKRGSMIGINKHIRS